jgi:hypothetical protein
MNVLLSVTAHTDRVCVTTSITDADHEVDERQSTAKLQPQPLAIKYTTFEGSIKAAFELHTEGCQSQTIKIVPMEAPAEALLVLRCIIRFIVGYD